MAVCAGSAPATSLPRAGAGGAKGPAPETVDVLDLDLEHLARAGGPRALAPRPFRGATPASRRVGALGGLGLAAAILHDAAADGGRAPPLVVSVGTGVRRGLPTAARATVATRAPLGGGYGDGQVGGDLGPRLAGLADALVVRGTTAPGGAVLVVSAGEVELLLRPALEGVSAAGAAELLVDELGPCAVLAVGPAGRRRLPIASLASGEHVVGRGGLGAVLGRLGLAAIAVRADAPRPDADPGRRALLAALVASPRLRARAAGGTLELYAGLAAGGELAREAERALEAEIARSAAARQGCAGCPTPCGWTFTASGGEERGARFGAVRALGVELGLDTFDEALALVARCDELGVDAKEVGATLELRARAVELGRLPGPSARGDLARLLGWIDELLDEGERPGAVAARGAAAFARATGLEPELARRAGDESNLARRLGRAVSPRGADPMRTFPFLVGEGAPAGRLRELLAPLAVPEGADDPADARGKGRVVAWHEDLVAALDASGFCSFSAAGLLADGACTLDELAGWIAPGAAAAPGRAMLDGGAAITLLLHDLALRWGRTGSCDAALERPGLAPEYRALRGLDADLRPTPEAWGGLARGERPGGLVALAEATDTDEVASDGGEDERARARGTVSVRCSGLLARSLGERSTVALDLPAGLPQVLAALADAHPAGRDLLLRAGRPLPAAFRAGRRLAERDLLADGDEVELVLVVAGG